LGSWTHRLQSFGFAFCGFAFCFCRFASLRIFEDRALNRVHANRVGDAPHPLLDLQPVLAPPEMASPIKLFGDLFGVVAFAKDTFESIGRDEIFDSVGGGLAEANAVVYRPSTRLVRIFKPAVAVGEEERANLGDGFVQVAGTGGAVLQPTCETPFRSA
jgi:hypothetical protein